MRINMNSETLNLVLIVILSDLCHYGPGHLVVHCSSSALFFHHSFFSYADAVCGVGVTGRIS